MGSECCFSYNNAHIEFYNEIKKEGKISQLETKGNCHFNEYSGVFTSSAQENIIFEVQDNPLIDFSKEIFSILNNIRMDAETAYSFAIKYGLTNEMNDLIMLNNRPSAICWSSKKSRYISDFFQNPKNTFKSINNKIKEIQQKYNEEFITKVYSIKSEKNNAELCLANLFKTLDKNKLNSILNENYAFCIIYSETICNVTFAEVVNQKDINTYFFFLQKMLNDIDEK